MTSNLGKNCDLCWDDESIETPASWMVLGIPVCARHSNFTTTLVKKAQGPEGTKMASPVRTPMSTPNGPKAPRKSAIIAAAGIKTAKDFAELMTTMMDDLLVGSIDVSTAMAVCSAGDRLLKVAEMQIRYRSNKMLLLGRPQAVTEDE